MKRRRSGIATLTLLAVCCAALAPARGYPACAIASLARSAPCARSFRPCCCAPADAPRVCGCDRRDDPAPPPLKWNELRQQLPWLAADAEIAPLGSNDELTAASRSPRGPATWLARRAIQALLCIWRI